MTHDMDPTAGSTAAGVDEDAGRQDIDSEAVVDELDVDTEAPLDEAAPTYPDGERVVPEPEDPAAT